MPLYPLGISRRRDVPSVPKQAAGAIDVRWSLAGELACAFIDAPHQAVPPMLHATALDAIHRRICVLPVRFGVALRDEAEIHSCCKIVATNCSTTSAALIGLAKWGCGSHRRPAKQRFAMQHPEPPPAVAHPNRNHRWPTWKSADRTINGQMKTRSETA